MDILSHGLWGGIVAGRESRKNFWLAFGFGLAPDLFSFGIFTGMRILGLASGLDWSNGLPPESAIPEYVHVLYDITHSLVIFSIAFLLVWYFRKKPLIPMAAWGLHILIDIPTHSTQFFPTPFLWPLMDVKINGIPWSNPAIFIPNVILLASLYLWFFVIQKRVNKKVR